MENYFQRFPILSYSNTTCRDITRRVKLDEKTRNALTLYYTYEVKDGTRTDLISDAYYNDPSLDWLIWMTNGMVDPYYQWNLSERDFTDYLTKKYGSVENSIKKIAYYRNNWYDDDKVLTPEFYNNHLEQNWKKYYAPFYGPGVKILYWRRREEDWVMETNKIYKLTMTDTTGYIEGELVDFNTAGGMRTGGGEITAVSDTYVMIKNVDGLFGTTPGNSLVGETSGTSQSMSAFDTVYEAITDDEGVFWSPVTYYDIENEKNAYSRSISILDKNYLPTTMDQLDKLMAE